MFDDVTDVEVDNNYSSIEENNVSISSYPNPANSQVQIMLRLNSNEESELRIVITQLNFVYTGKLEGENKIDGSFTQMGQTMELDMTKKEE